LFKDDFQKPLRYKICFRVSKYFGIVPYQYPYQTKGGMGWKWGETSSSISCLLHVSPLSEFGYSFLHFSQELKNAIYDKFISDLDTPPDQPPYQIQQKIIITAAPPHQQSAYIL